MFALRLRSGIWEGKTPSFAFSAFAQLHAQGKGHLSSVIPSDLCVKLRRRSVCHH
jgi:hypothetical protein